MTLFTARLRLRPPNQDDKRWIYALNHDPLWIRFIGNRGVHNLRDAQIYIEKAQEHFDAHGYGLFALETRFTHQPVGMCGLINRGIFSGPDLGFALLPEFRGQGYGLEAALRLLGYAQDELGLSYLTAMTHVDNVDSQRLLKKLGYQKMGQMFLTGVFPQQFFWLDLSRPSR